MTAPRIDLSDLRAYLERFQPTRNVCLLAGEVLALVAAVEAAQRVDRIYEGLRTDANDGTFALWSEDDLVVALHALDAALAPFVAERTE